MENLQQQESFFVSESLRDVLDAQIASGELQDPGAQEHDAIRLFGTFVSLSQENDRMTVEVNSSIAKSLLFNSASGFVFKFMDKDWHMWPKVLFMEQKKEGKFHVRLLVRYIQQGE